MCHRFVTPLFWVRIITIDKISINRFCLKICPFVRSKQQLDGAELDQRFCSCFKIYSQIEDRETTRLPLLLNLARPGKTHCWVKSLRLNLFLSIIILLFILERKFLNIILASGKLLSIRTRHLAIQTAYLYSAKR